MRALILDNKARAEIARVIQYAEAHKIPLDEMKSRIANPKEWFVMGENPEMRCYIEDGFKCVLSIEEQHFGWCKHLSVSVNAKDKFPSIEATRMLMNEFGITKDFAECAAVYIEDVKDDEGEILRAINIISKI